MTRYATTGPSELRPVDRASVRQAVEDMEAPSVIVTGGAKGWDIAFASAAVCRWPLALHRIIVPQAPYAEADVDALVLHATREGIRVECVLARWPEDRRPATAYRYRNEELVDQVDPFHVGDPGVFVAAVRHGAVYYRSGEWMTLNMARTRPGVRVVLVDLGAGT